MAQGGPPLVPAGQINQGPENNASPPRVTITSTAIFGSAALSNSIDTYPVQAIYTSTRFTDRHTVKFGADYMAAYYDYTLYSPLAASYSFSSLIDADWGPQTDTPKVRGVLSGWWSFRPSMQVSGSFRARSGIALNPVASGVDLNGDGNLSDRTPGFGRNSFRGPVNSQLDARYSWSVPLKGSTKLQVYLESFNLLNQENVLTVNSDYGANPAAPKATWMQSLSWAPPREVQLGARISF